MNEMNLDDWNEFQSNLEGVICILTLSFSIKINLIVISQLILKVQLVYKTLWAFRPLIYKLPIQA